MLRNKTYYFKLFLLGLIMTGSLINMALAQDTVLSVTYRGKLDSINSTTLKQKRFFQVFIPPGYKSGSSDKFDVLYVLDGSDYNTRLINEVQGFVEWHDYMPPTIIVSVNQIDRNVELTPTHMDASPGSGGADKFLGFIKNELVPYINTNYPSDNDNTLWGHSLGGMFVMYALLREPSLFHSYIASDPSVWWDDGYVTKMASAKLSSLPFQNTTLFVSGRDIDVHDMKIDTLDAVLKKSAPVGLKWKLTVYEGETHSAVRLKTTYDALKFTYAGTLKHMDFDPMNGIVLKDKPFKLFYSEDTSRLHYTIDGSVPTINSPKVQPVITMNGPATVTFKVFTNRSRYDKIKTGLFTAEQMSRPISFPQHSQAGGFSYAYYEGDWEKMPDFKNLKPLKTGIADSVFDADKFARKNHFALVIDGLLETKEEGYYIFYLAADSGSRLFIDDKLVVTWDGECGQAFSGIVPLSKGFYPFRIEYLRHHEECKLAWAYLTPVFMEIQAITPIPFSLQYGTHSK
jgi:predicted alpha/beta superfamily hydrolase